MKTIFTTLIVLTILMQEVMSQYKPTAVFGLHAEPIIPTGLFRIREEIVDFDKVSFKMIPQTGYLIGSHIAIHYTPKFAIESGINMIKRDFELSATENEDVNTLRFTVQNFEIPLALTYYVRVGERMYMGHTVGVSFQMLPSHLISRIRKRNPNGSDFEFEQLSYRNSWLVPTFKGGIGFEYRTDEKGHFFCGPVYHLFRPLYKTRILYKNDTVNETLFMNPIGDFFGVIFRYNFQPSPLNIKKKPKKTILSDNN
jgi:hypothetical protein